MKVVKMIMHSLFIVFDFRQSVLSFKVERKCVNQSPQELPLGPRGQTGASIYASLPVEISGVGKVI